MQDVRQITEDEAAHVRVFERSSGLQTLLRSRYWRSARLRSLVSEVAEALGSEVTEASAFVLA